MYYRLFIALLFLLPNYLLAQWNWVNPLPQGNTLHDVQFLSASTGFAVGDGGTVLKTTDGGYSWDRMESGTMESLGSVFFLDALTGYAVANEGPSLYKTTDGGSTWVLDYRFDTFDLNDVWFTDPLHGVIVGYESVFITNDGGLSWSWNAPYSWNYSVWFTDPSTAIMSSEYVLYKSYDAGNTWTIKQWNVYGWRGSLFFMDADTGIHVGSAGQIFRTTDAGETWDSIQSGTSNVLSACYISPNGTGYAVGFSGTLLKTNDAGATWVSLLSGTLSNLETITFTDASHGVITGELGYTMITEDGGISWNTSYSSVTKSNLNAVVFPDQNTGYAAGAGGTILKSTDGGNSWQQLSVPVWNSFFSLCYTNPQTIYFAGTNGMILKTTNGGGSWESLLTGVNYNLTSIEFPDQQTGYAIGRRQDFYDSVYLLKTTDAGATWSSRVIDNGVYYSMDFTNADTGYLAGYPRDLKRTTDGGISWNTQASFPGFSFSDIYFTSRNRGFACGYGITIQTSDAGLHWDILYSGPLNFKRFYFTDSLHGYVLADYGYSGGGSLLYKTEDGGTTWSEKPIGLTNYQLNDLCFTHSDIGFTVGGNGVILKTTNGGGIITGTQNENNRASTEPVIYPNPCSGYFRIRLPQTLPQVDVGLFSITGNEVWSSEFQNVSEINISQPGLTSGFYFVKIRTASSVVTRKLVISR